MVRKSIVSVSGEINGRQMAIPQRQCGTSMTIGWKLRAAAGPSGGAPKVNNPSPADAQLFVYPINHAFGPAWHHLADTYSPFERLCHPCELQVTGMGRRPKLSSLKH